MEGASLRPFGQAGHLTADGNTFPGLLHCRVSHRNRAEQRLGIGVKGVAVKLITVRDFNHSAQVHYQNPVADMFYHSQVMGYKQISQAQLGLQFLQQVDDLGLYGNIQRGYGFIADDHIRLR